MSSIYFREEGSGPPLVFLHGFCDSHQLWSEFVAPFTSSFRVLMPDLPGFGRSAMLAAPFTIDDAGDALAAWMHKEGIYKPFIIGHSLGGYVALSILTRHPSGAAAVGLFHSTPYGDSPERKKVRDRVIRFVEENGVAPFIETFVPGLFLDKLDPNIASTRQRSLATDKVALILYARAMRDRPDRSEITIRDGRPILVIAGANDSLIPIDDLRKFAKMSQKVSFFELANTAHMGIFEAKKQCQSIISGFAEEVLPNNRI